MIKKKKRNCIDCGKVCYSRRCTYCTNAIKIQKSAAKKKAVAKPAKKTTKPKKEKSTIANAKIAILKKHADDIFSLAIRLRDCDKEGYGKCITCNAVCFFYSGFEQKNQHKCFSQNGHFRSRAKMSTRFHKQNNHSQCQGCNGKGGGKPYEYGLAIDKLYGDGTSIKIHELSLKTVKFGRMEYIEVIIDSIQCAESELAKKSFTPEFISHIQGKIDFYKNYLSKIGV